MLDNPIPLQDLIKDFQRAATVHHEVLGNDFKPIDDGFLIKDVLIMRDAQADAHTIIRVSVETIRRHGVLPRSVKTMGELRAGGSAASPHVVNLIPLIGAGFALATCLGAAATLAGARVLALVGPASTLALTRVLSGTTVFRYFGCG
jgi:hypothetical protein